MPTYNFYNKETKEEQSEFMNISALEQFLVDNPHLEQLVSGAPMIGDPTRMMGFKPDTPFKDRLKEIKKNFPGSTINTF